MIKDYVNKTKAPLTPAGVGEEFELFWKAARIPRRTKQSDLESRLKDLEFKRRLLLEIGDQDSNISIQIDE